MTQETKINKVETFVHENLFTIIKQDKKYKIAVGNVLISELTFTKLADAKKYIESKPYEIIVNLIGLAIDKFNEYNKLKNENHETDTKN